MFFVVVDFDVCVRVCVCCFFILITAHIWYKTVVYIPFLLSFELKKKSRAHAERERERENTAYVSQYEKTYLLTCVFNKDSNQTAHPHSRAHQNANSQIK